MALSSYADVQVSFQAQSVSRAGFGTLLFVTENTDFSAPEVRGPFGSLDEVTNDYGSASEPYKFAQEAFSQGQGFSSLKIGHKATGDTWTDAIADIVNNGDADWYAIAIESRNAADIELVAAEAQARRRLFIAVTADSDVLDGNISTDIATSLLDQSYNRTGLLYKSDGATTYPEAAWFGRMLPLDPGTVNWAYKSLSGVAVDNFTTAERGALRDKRANYYEMIAGNPITYGGYTSEAGKFLDIIRGVDWLQTRMQEDFIALQTSQNRIPYVGGGEIIESQVVRRRLDIAVAEGVVANDYSVTVPQAQDQDPTERSSRNYPGITFTANYIGAVNKIEIDGVVSP